MEDKLHQSLDLVFDLAERNNAMISWQVPSCDDEGNSILLQNSNGNTGLMYHNQDQPDTPVHFYTMNVDLYHWAILEGFTDDDIFESEDFDVLQRTDFGDFCRFVCSLGKNKSTPPKSS